MKDSAATQSRAVSDDIYRSRLAPATKEREEAGRILATAWRAVLPSDFKAINETFTLGVRHSAFVPGRMRTKQ